MKILLFSYCGYCFIVSICTLFLFKKDKRMAKKQNEIRIKEKTLLSFIALGGALGGLLGSLIFHHKTNKIYFTFSIFISLVLQICVLILLCLLCGGRI